MRARLVDGKAMAREIRTGLAREVGELAARGIRPHLVVLAVGEDPAGQIYLKNQARQCAEVGIRHTLKTLPSNKTEEELALHVMSLNYDPDVTGILVTLPLPAGIDAKRVQGNVWREKDVEGMNPANLGALLYGEQLTTPCTPLAVLEILRRTGTSLRGKEVTIVGHSNIVGKPLAILLVNEMATVAVCHEATADLARHTRNAEILVVAVGKPGLVTGDMVRPGATVIDVGISQVPDTGPDGRPVLDAEGRPKLRTAGDVDLATVGDVAGLVTPVPGGVGPLTVAMLLANTVACARRPAAGPDRAG